ncbi:hypothetical protein JI742_13205 [Piscinibacter sp. Jin2]|uniref:Transmembrane protein n=1 Tax=Aquariibacter lacus TaxID=2801332 RepID=A0A9X0XJW0_9BURK|nr:hypothetical protein [Piscinibacter lacus]MBL0720845.1 hypothetical protein [Piscinibacter lacus]
MIVLPEDQERALRTVGVVSYLLHAVVAVGALIPTLQPGILLLLIAIVLDLVKREEAAGTWQASHFRWRIHSVLWAGGLYVLTFPLWFLFVLPGWLAWTGISLWFLVRIVRGWIHLNDQRPIDEPA